MNYKLLEAIGLDEMPSDVGAEQSVLGSILLENTCFETVNERLRVGQMHDPGHKRIFRAMGRLYKAGTSIDIVTLTSALQDSEELDDIGGVSYLSSLSNAVPSAASVGHYADRVHEVHLRRQALETASEMMTQAAEGGDIKKFVSMAEKGISKLADQATPAREFVTIKEALLDVWEDTEQKYKTKDVQRGVTGLSTGLADVDRMTAGLQKSDLIIIAARPSVGKTALALNIAQHAGVKEGETVAVFSLEMSAKQLVARMISAEGHISANKMKTGYFEGDDWEKMSHAVGALAGAGIFIDDTPGISVTEIRSKCRRLKKERDLGLIVIDYLQLVQGRGDNRQQEVSDISRTLKQVARELDVPVIALSQLSRGVEQRQNKRPMMSDLRESGSIEQDADIVAFLYRDDYYDKETEKKNIVEVIIAKQRNGPVGTVELAFIKEYGKYADLHRQQELNDDGYAA